MQKKLVSEVFQALHEAGQERNEIGRADKLKMPKQAAEQYPREVKQETIKKVQEGGRGILTAVAKELGVPKTTIKYWLDNADKILGSDEADGFTQHPTVMKIQKQIVEHGWKLYFKIIKRLNTQLEEASFRDLIYGASELQNKLMELKPLNGLARVSTTTEVQVSEERKVTVRRFLEKQQERLGMEKDEKIALSGAGPEPPPVSEAQVVELVEEQQNEGKKKRNG